MASSRYRDSIAPAYLFLCLILGGSAQGIWQNMVLQLLGLAIIAWAAAEGHKFPSPVRQLFVIGLCAIAWVAIQMVPLPPGLWTHLGGRELIANGYRVLGIEPPWLPLSVTPYRSLDSLFGLIPPIAIFVAIATGPYRPTWLAAALIVGAIAGLVLGALQVSQSGNIANSPWYLYPETSYGLATGFFANANHMAALLLCTLPFLAALLASRAERRGQWNPALIVAASAAAILMLVGIVLSRSLAVTALAVPVLAASVIVLLPERSSWRRWSAIAAGLLAIAAIVGLATTPVGTRQVDDQSSIESRQDMLATSGRAIRDFLPWGSGLGSFRSVYQLYEDPGRVDNSYVPHAHNDYVEVALEAGLAGIVLMVAFIAWWVRATFRAWRSRDAGAYARAASIASGAILLHSLVDFPLRTAAISALFAMCLAMLVQRSRIVARVRPEWRPARHVVIE